MADTPLWAPPGGAHRSGTGAIDDGPWLAARLDSPAPVTAVEGQTEGTSTENRLDSSVSYRRNSRGYVWRFWRFNWGMPASGEHTVRSRAFDVNGNLQP